MYSHRKALQKLVRYATAVAWRVYGEDPNAHLWNIVERRPWSCIFDRLVPCNTPYLVLEYPKCGMTWLRYMIYQATAIKHPQVSLEDAVMEVQHRDIRVPRIRCTSRFIFDPRTRKQGIVFLVRQPERVMVSNYFHTRYRLRQHEMSVSEFIRDEESGIGAYVSFVEHCMTNLQRFRHIVVRYEDMRRDTAHELRRVLEFIELPLPDDAVQEVVAGSSFEAMRRAEQERRFNVEWLTPPSNDPRVARVRTGGADKLEDLFSEDDLRLMRDCYGRSQVFRELGYADGESSTS